MFRRRNGVAVRRPELQACPTPAPFLHWYVLVRHGTKIAIMEGPLRLFRGYPAPLCQRLRWIRDPVYVRLLLRLEWNAMFESPEPYFWVSLASQTLVNYVVRKSRPLAAQRKRGEVTLGRHFPSKVRRSAISGLQILK